MKNLLQYFLQFSTRKKIIICFMCGVTVVFLWIFYSSSLTMVPIPKSTAQMSLFDSNSSRTSQATDVKDEINAIDVVSINYKVNNSHQFSIRSDDVLVFLHIQKTGGSTFGRHLVHDLKLNPPCVKSKHSIKRFNCPRPNGDNTEWLFSRFTSGWVCGVHADWTSLTECVPGYYQPLKEGTRRYFYFTFLREPVARYLSEWGHVGRGATWEVAYFLCNGIKHKPPLCWSGSNGTGISIEKFMNCPYNLANNRQTRMLANLREIGCTGKKLDTKASDRIMLDTAKRNLQEMEFFGLTERQRQSQVLFENAFNLQFNVEFSNINDTHASVIKLTDELLQKIKRLNSLDMELYDFAVKLLDERWDATTRGKSTY